MPEIIVKMGDHIKLKGGEYVRDLVRCKDCRWYERDIYDREAGVCFNPHKCTKTLGFEVLNEDYCSYGETKDEQIH